MTFDNYNVCKKHLHMVREGEQVTLVPEWRWDTTKRERTHKIID